MKITAEFLMEKNACPEAIEAFKKRFGSGADYQAVLDALAEEGHGSSALWLINTVGPVNSVMERAKATGSNLYVAGSLRVQNYIELAGSLLVGGMTTAGEGIKVGRWINSKSIEAGEGIEVSEGIETNGGIRASRGIKALGGIKAGEWIFGEWIEAGGPIQAEWIKTAGKIRSGRGIRTDRDIEAGEIEAGGDIEAGGWIKTSGRIRAGRGIRTDRNLEAGGWIEAGEGIEVSEGIKTSGGIRAGGGIKAGFSISCRLSIHASLRIFAGLCNWRLPNAEETKIICAKLIEGQVAFGELIETGAYDEE